MVGVPRNGVGLHLFLSLVPPVPLFTLWRGFWLLGAKQQTIPFMQTCLHFLLRLRGALANGLLLGRGYHSQHSRASLPQVGTTCFSSVSSLSHKFRGFFNLCSYKPHEVIKSHLPPLNDPRLFTLDHNCPFVFRFSPTRKATLEEKLVSVIVLVFFLLKAVLAMGRLN